jgi:hypothetical protein
MGQVFDIIIFDDLDLEIKDGDFVLEESTGQHINHILIANQGDYRQTPLLGADIQRLLSDEANPNEVKADIQAELEKDGLQIEEISLQEKIKIIAAYK